MSDKYIDYVHSISVYNRFTIAPVLALLSQSTDLCFSVHRTVDLICMRRIESYNTVNKDNCSNNAVLLNCLRQNLIKMHVIEYRSGVVR